MIDMRRHLGTLLVGGLIGLAEERGDYATFGFDPSDPRQERVHLDSSIDPFALADVLIEAIPALQSPAAADLAAVSDEDLQRRYDAAVRETVAMAAELRRRAGR